MLRQAFTDQLKAAMKARDAQRVGTLRLVNAAIKNAEIEAQVRGQQAIADQDVLGILRKMVKQRQESLEIYDRAGRKELADKERSEIEIISQYLPREMSEDEMKAAISTVMQEVAAAGMKDMGKVMTALRQGYAGKMDFAKASTLVKGMLAG